MRIRWMLPVLAMVVLGGSAHSQDFGVMESAETINPGNFKLMGYPILVFGEDGADDEFGLALRGGYGFSNNFDAELKVAFFDGLTFLGADAEFWLLKGGNVDLSLSGGAHLALAGDEFFDSTGIDLTVLGSTHLSDRFELYAALDFAFEFLSDVPEGLDDSFTTIHLVPGIEYKLTDDLDLDAEFGIGLNDDSFHYLAAGFAYYIR